MSSDVNNDLAATVVRVGRALRKHTQANGTTLWSRAAEELGWTVPQLKEFREEFAFLLNLDTELAMATPPPALPVSDADLLTSNGHVEIPDEAPSDDALALAIKDADQKLAKGLEALGLLPKEVQTAVALQSFNKHNFKESMDIVSSTVLRTDLKCVMQQDAITERLALVREQIKSYSDIASEERDQWVKEERLLMQQFIELGQLTVNIQDTWYKGAANLALVKFRMGHGSSPKMAKPGFRPNAS